jgi:hypothetical protein
VGPERAGNPFAKHPNEAPTGIFASVLAFPGYCAIPDQSKQPIEGADLDELSASTVFYLCKANPELLLLF